MWKKHSFLSAIAFAAFMFNGAFIDVAYTEQGGQYNIDAEIPRIVQVRRWEQLVCDGVEVPKPNPSFLDSINSVNEQPDIVRYEFFCPDPLSYEEIPFTIEDWHAMDADGPTTKSIKVAAYVTSMLTEPPEGDDPTGLGLVSGWVPCRFFNPDLTPMDEAAIGKITHTERDREEKLSGTSHQVSIIYDIVGLESPRVLYQWLFDQNTRRSLSDHIGWDNYYQHRGVDFQIECWRPAPVDWMIDIAHGPVQTRELEPVEDARADFDDVQLRILKLSQGNAKTSKSRAERTRDEQRSCLYEVSWNTNHRDQDASILFAVSPAELTKSLYVEVLDDGGEVIGKEDFIEKVPHIAIIKFKKVKLDQIKKIRVAFRPYRRRVIIPIDALPGQPESNRDLKNLAQIKIPYIHFFNQWMMEKSIRSLLQVRNMTTPFMDEGKIVPLEFPRSYTDVTVNKLLADWVSQYPGCEVYVDEAADLIEIKDPNAPEPPMLEEFPLNEFFN